MEQAASDYVKLKDLLDRKGWSPDTDFDPDKMQPVLLSVRELSPRAVRTLRSQLLARFARERIRLRKPFTVGDIVTRAASLDWNILDLFYQLAGFKHFKRMFDLAEDGSLRRFLRVVGGRRFIIHSTWINPSHRASDAISVTI